MTNQSKIENTYIIPAPLISPSFEGLGSSEGVHMSALVRGEIPLLVGQASATPPT